MSITHHYYSRPLLYHSSLIVASLHMVLLKKNIANSVMRSFYYIVGFVVYRHLYNIYYFNYFRSNWGGGSGT